MVEINCETDFVARTPDFRQLARDVAMQVAAMSPKYVSEDDVPAEEWEALEREHGDRKKAAEAVALLSQPFIKDPKSSIRDLVRTGIAKLGENVQVSRFARFEVGADRPAVAELGVRGTSRRYAAPERAGKVERRAVCLSPDPPQAERRGADGRDAVRHRPLGGEIDRRADQAGRRARRPDRHRRRRRQHLARPLRQREGDGPRHRRLHGHGRDGPQRAGPAGRLEKAGVYTAS
jgi:hypothetical protein